MGAIYTTENCNQSWELSCELPQKWNQLPQSWNQRDIKFLFKNIGFLWSPDVCIHSLWLIIWVCVPAAYPTIFMNVLSVSIRATKVTFEAIISYVFLFLPPKNFIICCTRCTFAWLHIKNPLHYSRSHVILATSNNEWRKVHLLGIPPSKTAKMFASIIWVLRKTNINGMGQHAVSLSFYLLFIFYNFMWLCVILFCWKNVLFFHMM